MSTKKAAIQINHSVDGMSVSFALLVDDATKLAASILKSVDEAKAAAEQDAKQDEDVTDLEAVDVSDEMSDDVAQE
jgi:hypothetical protein